MSEADFSLAWLRNYHNVLRLQSFDNVLDARLPTYWFGVLLIMASACMSMTLAPSRIKKARCTLMRNPLLTFNFFARILLWLAKSLLYSV